MNKQSSVTTALVLGGYLFLGGQSAPGSGPAPTAEAGTAASSPGIVIAKKAKPQGAKKGGKSGAGEEQADSSKKKAPTKAEALKDIDDISKK